MHGEPHDVIVQRCRKLVLIQLPLPPSALEARPLRFRSHMISPNPVTQLAVLACALALLQMLPLSQPGFVGLSASPL